VVGPLFVADDRHACSEILYTLINIEDGYQKVIIWAGDFNSSPSSVLYHFMKSSKIYLNIRNLNDISG